MYSWAIIFSHPADFTPVCTTELSKASCLQLEFEKRGVKMMGLSIDSVESHKKWTADINSLNEKTCKNLELRFPMMAADRKLAADLGMLDYAELDKDSMPLTARSVFIIGPDLKLKASLLYPATSGRNFELFVVFFKIYIVKF